MTEIYLIRHAEAEGNLYRRIHGQFESLVTPNGRRQIEALSRRFAAVPVDACYASDLLRTRTTAQALCVPKGLPLQTDPAFREIHLGVWENETFGWLYTFEGEAMRQFDADPRHWHVDGSERFEDYTARFLRAMTAAAEAHDGGTIAIFSHGAVLRGVFLALFPELEVGHCDNTAVSLLRYEQGGFTPVFLNDNGHLDERISTLAKQNWWRKDGPRRDHNLWFRPGLTALEDLTPPARFDRGWTAMHGHQPVGLVCLTDGPEDEERLTYLGLTGAFRGKDLAVQLLGQAVFSAREAGKTRLRLQVPAENGPLASFCRRQDLCPDRDGVCVMDIGLHM